MKAEGRLNDIKFVSKALFGTLKKDIDILGGDNLKQFRSIYDSIKNLTDNSNMNERRIKELSQSYEQHKMNS